MSSVIDTFDGPYVFLSNFYPCPVVFDGLTYPTSEHAYQAAKSTDRDYQLRICYSAATPAKAKRLGRKAVLRPNWEAVKCRAMYYILEQKFKPGTELAQRLLSTDGHELVEGNWWGDVYWGKCRGIGENNLGKLLMRLRDQLKAAVQDTPKETGNT